MKTYYFSIDFEQAGFDAETADKAMDMAEEAIKESCYSIQLVDVDELEDVDCLECGKLKPLCACVISKKEVGK